MKFLAVIFAAMQLVSIGLEIEDKTTHHTVMYQGFEVSMSFNLELILAVFTSLRLIWLNV